MAGNDVDMPSNLAKSVTVEKGGEIGRPLIKNSYGQYLLGLVKDRVMRGAS